MHSYSQLSQNCLFLFNFSHDKNIFIFIKKNYNVSSKNIEELATEPKKF